MAHTIATPLASDLVVASGASAAPAVPARKRRLTTAIVHGLLGAATSLALLVMMVFVVIELVRSPPGALR